VIRGREDLIAFAALPPSVRKGSAFPEGLYLLEATPRYLKRRRSLTKEVEFR
jgi:hypothetical protein